MTRYSRCADPSAKRIAGAITSSSGQFTKNFGKYCHISCSDGLLLIVDSRFGFHTGVREMIFGVVGERRAHNNGNNNLGYFGRDQAGPKSSNKDNSQLNTPNLGLKRTQ